MGHKKGEGLPRRTEEIFILFIYLLTFLVSMGEHAHAHEQGWAWWDAEGEMQGSIPLP